MTKPWPPPRFPLDQTSPQPSQELGSYPITIPEKLIEEQKAVTAIVNTRLDIAMPRTKGEVDMEAIRNLLFSIRDQCIYCPVCRCPEFAANEMRSSHFEPCSIGEMCEKLLKLYPREGYVVKWRK